MDVKIVPILQDKCNFFTSFVMIDNVSRQSKVLFVCIFFFVDNGFASMMRIFNCLICAPKEMLWNWSCRPRESNHYGVLGMALGRNLSLVRTHSTLTPVFGGNLEGSMTGSSTIVVYTAVHEREVDPFWIVCSCLCTVVDVIGWATCSLLPEGFPNHLYKHVPCMYP